MKSGKGFPWNIGREDKRRIYIAVHARAYPWDKRKEKGTAFYHYDLVIEPKNAAEEDNIWIAYCGNGPNNTWRVHEEYTNMLELKEKLVMLVMIGKVPEHKWREAKTLVTDADYPLAGEDQSHWLMNVITDLRRSSFVGAIDNVQLMDFILKEADKLVEKDRNIDEIVEELKVADGLARKFEVDGSPLETRAEPNVMGLETEELNKALELRKKMVPRLNFDGRRKFP